MRIISLVGEHDTGKTTTLKKLILELCCNRSAIIQDVSNVGRYSTFITSKKVVSNPIENYINQHLDVTIVVNYNGKRIGITTVGDGWAFIKEQLNRMGSCDVVIFACHDTQQVWDNMRAYIDAQGNCVTTVIQVLHKKCITVRENPEFEKCCDCRNQMSINEILSLL